LTVGTLKQVAEAIQKTHFGQFIQHLDQYVKWVYDAVRHPEFPWRKTANQARFLAVYVVACEAHTNPRYLRRVLRRTPRVISNPQTAPATPDDAGLDLTAGTPGALRDPADG
jgi:hypothetical protein